MLTGNKRPTVPSASSSSSRSKTFNPKTTHPASIPTMSGLSIQKKEHVTQSGSESRPSDPELGQSGGGGGGGTGAGSLDGAGDTKDLDDLAKGGSGKGGKGIDSSKVHPGSVSGDQKGGKRDSKL